MHLQFNRTLLYLTVPLYQGTNTVEIVQNQTIFSIRASGTVLRTDMFKNLNTEFSTQPSTYSVTERGSSNMV